MNRARVNSNIMYLLKEAYNKKGFYDSDGDGDENWQDDIEDVLDFEADKNEGKVNYISDDKIIKLKRNFGNSTILAKIAA